MDDSGDDSVRAWIQSAAPFLDAPGTAAASTEFTVARTP
jgi:hypothetical protein